MDLKSLHSLGRIEREFQIVKDLKVVLHTLSAVEQQQALAELPNTASSTDVIHRTVILQASLLIYALTSVNDEKMDLQKSKEFIQGLQSPIFNEIYNCYETIAQEQDKTVEELKKK